MSDFFLKDLVTDRPDPTLDFHEDVCPSCGSTKIRDGGMSQTLVGWRGGNGITHPNNPNHSIRFLTCCDCLLQFTKEVKCGNVWIARGDDDDRRLLAGVPSCFEAYTYTCCHCGGGVTRRYTDLDGEKEVRGLRRSRDENGEWKKFYRTFYHCTECGKQLETEKDYGP